VMMVPFAPMQSLLLWLMGLPLDLPIWQGFLALIRIPNLVSLLWFFHHLLWELCISKSLTVGLSFGHTVKSIVLSSSHTVPVRVRSLGSCQRAPTSTNTSWLRCFIWCVSLMWYKMPWHLLKYYLVYVCEDDSGQEVIILYLLLKDAQNR
jgi:hypothetical protein